MAAEDNSTELLPLIEEDEPIFDVGIRGYDKRQVDSYVSQAETQIAELKAARDAALATSADRAAQLASREAHIESLKQQAAKAAEAPSPVVHVSDRIRDMLQLATDEAAQTRRAAEEEAADIRRAAEQEADRVLSAARADAERVRGEAAAAQQRLTASATQRSAEADQKLAQARVQAATELDKARTQAATQLDSARAEAGRILDQATAELDKAEAAAAAITEAAEAERNRLEAANARAAADRASIERLRTAEQDFEITLRSRRSTAERQAHLDQQAAHEAAERLIAEARQRAEALDAEREHTHQRLRELHQQLGAVIADAATP
jgi:cell division septum initiation protein DivIVA